MKNYIICLFLTFFLTSCVKETDFDTNISKHSDYPQVEQPQDVIYDLSNSSWVITKIMYTDFMYEERSDTLIFDSLGNYSFNGFMSNYNFYPNVTNYRLDLTICIVIVNDKKFDCKKFLLFDYHDFRKVFPNIFLRYFYQRHKVFCRLIP